MIVGDGGKTKNSEQNKPKIIINTATTSEINSICIGVLAKFLAIEAGKIIIEVIKKIPTIFIKPATTRAVSSKNFSSRFLTSIPEIFAKSGLIVTNKSCLNQ